MQLLDLHRRMSSSFLLSFPEESNVWDVLQSLLTASDTPFVRSSPELAALANSWQTKLSLVITTILSNPTVVWSFRSAGRVTEALLNVVHANDGLVALAAKLFRREVIQIPLEGHEDYLSIVGLIDPRRDLLLRRLSLAVGPDDKSDSLFSRALPGSKLIGDLCIMAAKLAYENPMVIKKVLAEWKMELEGDGVYNCINKHQPENPTQVLMFSSKPENPPVLVVAFRGTMLFNSLDWSTDFDFVFQDLPGVGRMHVGFLEALSLVDRRDRNSLSSMVRKLCNSELEQPCSGLSDARELYQKSELAYDVTKDTLKAFVKQNQDGKIYITGHSLGGALAVVFTALLYYNEEWLAERIAGVYTFGQPQVGNEDFCFYMSKKLTSPINRYFRFVYSNDIVSRVPGFEFKHFGLCFYFTSSYREETRFEEPRVNLLSLPQFVDSRIAAAWELAQSMWLSYLYGDEYRESLASTSVRLFGLLLPGIADHSIVNYVNSVRLGPRVLPSGAPVSNVINLAFGFLSLLVKVQKATVAGTELPGAAAEVSSSSQHTERRWWSWQSASCQSRVRYTLSRICRSTGRPAAAPPQCTEYVTSSSSTVERDFRDVHVARRYLERVKLFTCCLLTPNFRRLRLKQRRYRRDRARAVAAL